MYSYIAFKWLFIYHLLLKTVLTTVSFFWNIPKRILISDLLCYGIEICGNWNKAVPNVCFVHMHRLRKLKWPKIKSKQPACFTVNAGVRYNFYVTVMYACWCLLYYTKQPMTSLIFIIRLVRLTHYTFSLLLHQQEINCWWLKSKYINSDWCWAKPKVHNNSIYKPGYVHDYTWDICNQD